jgi:nucleoside-diphosphate-sugar epimerase
MQELVVITGGAGFIGSHLTEGFLKNVGSQGH